MAKYFKKIGVADIPVGAKNINPDWSNINSNGVLTLSNKYGKHRAKKKNTMSFIFKVINGYIL